MNFLDHDIFIWSVTFASPVTFWWLLLIPVLIIFYILYKKYYHPSVNFSNTGDISALNTNFEKWKHTLFGLQLIGIAAFITAMAEPIDEKAANSFKKKYRQGIDIVLAMDISGSMLARDFQPNRLNAAKEKAIDFIEKRPNDRVGLAVYEGESFMKVPVTTDHTFLKDAVRSLETGNLKRGTAVGIGLGTAVSGLLESDAKSKTIILLTDGVNNTGSIDPAEAAKIAENYGIKVYTIGVGTNNESAPMPVKNMFGRTQFKNMPVKLDEKTLKDIAEVTGGEYFRAVDSESLQSIYDEIDHMEKTNIKVTDFNVEPPYRFHLYLIIGIILFFSPILLQKTVLRSIT